MIKFWQQHPVFLPKVLQNFCLQTHCWVHKNMKYGIYAVCLGVHPVMTLDSEGGKRTQAGLNFIKHHQQRENPFLTHSLFSISSLQNLWGWEDTWNIVIIFSTGKAPWMLSCISPGLRNKVEMDVQVQDAGWAAPGAYCFSSLPAKNPPLYFSKPGSNYSVYCDITRPPPFLFYLDSDSAGKC